MRKLVNFSLEFNWKNYFVRLDEKVIFDPVLKLHEILFFTENRRNMRIKLDIKRKHRQNIYAPQFIIAMEFVNFPQWKSNKQ